MMPVLALCAAAPLGAQQGAMASGSNTALDALRPLYMQVKAYLTQSAEQMPEDEFSYRATPEVRSFGEILGHVTNDQYYFCSAARNEDNPWQEDGEEIMGKAAMVDALRTSFEYCDDLYTSMSPADLAAPSDAFRGRRNRLHPLVYNVTHDFEHYGNLITYFRINGMVPPSSQRGGM
jgi:uncharacterized damage-inducible protein DinB